MLKPWLAVISRVRISAPATSRCQFSHLGDPFLKINTGNVRCLKLKAKSDAKFKYFDNRLLPELLNLDLLDFIFLISTLDHFQLVDFVNTHLLIKKHGVHVVCILVKSWLLNCTTHVLVINKCTTFSTALPRKTLLPNQTLLIQLNIRRCRLTPITSKVFLWHFPPLCLALLNNMHPNLHPQVLLIVTKFVFHRLQNGYPRR